MFPRFHKVREEIKYERERESKILEREKLLPNKEMTRLPWDNPKRSTTQLPWDRREY